MLARSTNARLPWRPADSHHVFDDHFIMTDRKRPIWKMSTIHLRWMINISCSTYPAYLNRCMLKDRIASNAHVCVIFVAEWVSFSGGAVHELCLWANGPLSGNARSRSCTWRRIHRIAWSSSETSAGYWIRRKEGMCHQTSNIRRTKSQKLNCFPSRLAGVFAQSIEAKW